MNLVNLSPMWRLVLSRGNFLAFLGGNELGRPVFFFHSIGGDVSALSALIGLLPESLAFYGVQTPKSNLTTMFAVSVEKIANHYVRVLTDFLPQGPFVLGGWSAGGVIALEVAQQLRAQGHDVPLLVVLDTPLYNTNADTRVWHPAYCGKLISNIPRWIANDLAADWDGIVLLRRLGRRLAQVARAIGAGITNRMPVPLVEGPGTAGWSEAQLCFARALYAAVRNYKPKPYDGRVLVYLAKTRPLFPLVEIRPGWQRISPRAEIIEVAGTHATMLQPSRVAGIAAHLRKQLENLVTESTQSLPSRGGGSAIARPNHELI